MYVPAHIGKRQMMVAREDVMTTVEQQSQYTQGCKHIHSIQCYLSGFLKNFCAV